MKKLIILSVVLLFSFIGFSQNTTYFKYTHSDGIKKDSIEISNKLVPMVRIFIEWGIKYDYDFSKRIGDIKGVYYGNISNKDHVGETVFRANDKDYIVINNDIYLYEVLNFIVFHEMYHIFANSGVDDHCYDYEGSGIMLPAIDGYITYVLCNWQEHVDRLFKKLKTVQQNETKRDYTTECKIFPNRND